MNSVCPLCDDTGWKPTDDDGVRRVVRCDCWRNRLRFKSLNDARIPPRYRAADLDSFRTDSDLLIRAVQKCRALIDSFPVVDKGLLFIGIPGDGKTHLAVAVLRAVIERTGAHGLFYDVRALLKVIRDTYNPVVRTTELDVIKPVLNAELLVLDDLGAEKTSDWVDETLNLIVNTRYNERRITIFTTNYRDREVDEKSREEVLIERVGHRIHSRLHEMCDFVLMPDVDYRKVGDEATPEKLARLAKHGSKTAEQGLPARSKPARAQLREPAVRDGKADLKWPGGRAGS